MAVQNIPIAGTRLNGSFNIYNDGNLGRARTIADPPAVVVWGGSMKGNNNPLAFTADNIDTMISVYGAGGDLLQQVQELQQQGVNSVLVKRVGMRRGFAMHIGASGTSTVVPTNQEDGYWIELIQGGTEFSERFGVCYDNASARLIVQDREAGFIVFDNLDRYPIDEGQVFVRGTAYTGAPHAGSSIGTFTTDSDGRVTTLTSVPLSKLAVSWTSTGGHVHAADTRIHTYIGDDGHGVSRMKLYEGMFQMFQDVQGYRFRYIASHPRATLDAPVKTNATAPAGTLAGTTYPGYGAKLTASQPDALGRVYIEFVDGRYEFYWDVSGDGTANYWSVNDTSSYSGTSKGGKVFGTDTFLEPNFAYSLAYFCHQQAHEGGFFAQGIVGVEMPQIGRPPSEWIGTKAVYGTSPDGAVTVSTNGSGLLGHKYVAGNTGYRSGAAYGGFIKTDEPYFDAGTEEADLNGQPVDLGKYLSIWATPEVFDPRLGVNGNRAYTAISCAAYAGMRSNLGLRNAPTFKDYVSGGVLTGALTRSNIADMSEMRFTIAVQDYKGIKVVDAPSAALPTSDFARQGSMELVAAVTDALTDTAESYMGRYISAEEEQALEKDLIQTMNGLIEAGIINRGSQLQLYITPDDRILGQANVVVDLIVPFELRRIIQNVNLRRAAD